MSTLNFNCTRSVMFVGGTSLYEITTTFWLKVAFITFILWFSNFFFSFGFKRHVLCFRVYHVKAAAVVFFIRHIFHVRVQFCFAFSPSPAGVSACSIGHRWWPLQSLQQSFSGVVSQWFLFKQTSIRFSPHLNSAAISVIFTFLCRT